MRRPLGRGPRGRRRGGAARDAIDGARSGLSTRRRSSTASAATLQLHAHSSPRTTWCGTATSSQVSAELRLASTRALLRAEGQAGEALAAAERVLDRRRELAIDDTSSRRAWSRESRPHSSSPISNEAEELLAIPESLEPGELTPFLQANALRLRARLDAARGEDEGSRRNASSAPPPSSASSAWSSTSPSRSSSTPSGSCRQGRRDEAEPLLAEARETFEQLEAAPWLERTAAAQPVACR